VLKEGDMGDFLVILYTGTVDVLRSVGTKYGSTREKKATSSIIGSYFTAAEDEED
jgi:hypothetical protein